MVRTKVSKTAADRRRLAANTPVRCRCLCVHVEGRRSGRQFGDVERETVSKMFAVRPITMVFAKPDSFDIIEQMRNTDVQELGLYKSLGSPCFFQFKPNA